MRRDRKSLRERCGLVIQCRDNRLCSRDREPASLQERTDQSDAFDVELAVLNLVRGGTDTLRKKAFTLVVLDRRQGNGGSFG